MVTPLKRCRVSKGISTYAVARAVGCNQSHYSRVESNLCGASAELAEALAKFFDGEITELEILYPERHLEPQPTAEVA